MKPLLFLLAMLPLAAFAQSKTDYINTMEEYQKLYNKGKEKKITAMFQGDNGKFITQELWDTIHAKYGKLISFKYLGPDETDPDKVVVFKTVYEKSTHAMSFLLNEELQFGTFRQNTSSDEIDKMMREAK